MRIVQIAVAAVVLGCPSWAAVFDYNVSVDTSFLGASPAEGLVMFSLTDTDASTTTEVSITNVQGFQPGSFVFRTGDVSGSLATSDLVMRDGNFVNGEFQIGAKFTNPFAFDVRFEILPDAPSNDLFGFAISNQRGGVLQLFTFSRGDLTLTVPGSSYVRVTSVPEPTEMATYLFLLTALAGCFYWRRQQQLS
jgi:hypothetical protein